MDGTAQEDKTAARGTSMDGGGDGGTGPVLPFNLSHWLFIFDGLSEYAETWWSESDFQMKLFLFLMSWFFVNVCLIWFCWRKYGDKLSQMLMKEESDIKEPFDGKNGLHTEDPLHNKYYASRHGEKIH